MTTRTHSVSKKREERRENDFYPTPPLLCTAICSRLSRLRPRSILDPGAGSGNFTRAAKAQWFDVPVTAVEIQDTSDDLRKAGADRIVIGNYLAPGPWVENRYVTERFDLIIGNPPYSLVEDFVARSIALLSDEGVLAFVLKLHFFGSRKRVELFAKYPHYAGFPVIPRPDFTGDGRDTAEYGLITWRKKAGVLDAKQFFIADQPIIWK